MDDDETTTDGLRPARVNWADLAYTGVSILAGGFGAIADGLGYLRAALAQHSAWVGEKQDFAQYAGRDLESIHTEEHPR